MKKSLSLLALALLGTGFIYAEEPSATAQAEQKTEAPAVALEEVKLEEITVPATNGAAQPAEAPAKPAETALTATAPAAAAAPAKTDAAPEVKTDAVAEVKTSQTFEESLDLVPRGTGKPEEPAAPAQAATPAPAEEKPAAEATKPQGPTLEEAAAQAQAPKDDDETCTTLCKKVCLGLKDQESKHLEEESSEPAEKPAISAELPGFVDIK